MYHNVRSALRLLRGRGVGDLELRERRLQVRFRVAFDVTHQALERVDRPLRLRQVALVELREGEAGDRRSDGEEERLDIEARELLPQLLRSRVTHRRSRFPLQAAPTRGLRPGPARRRSPRGSLLPRTARSGARRRSAP